ncbi:carbohydrate kinase [Pelagibius sp.]|uniref:carbohydrate kinase family protein n=1 Tax=Pelagibius sp. TaxID=1931238 RepID=UPI00261B8FAE|nr:carbohydrate kinase [Pelagibius sp.]
MFLICGEALYDVFPSAETETGFTFDARIGGSPFNVAIGLSRLGREAALFTGLSSDPLGRRLERTLKDEGVDTSYLVSKQNPTTLALVGLGAKGVPHYSFYGHEAADRSVGEADLPELSSSLAAVHFGSYSLVVEPTGSSFLELARRSRDAALISFDPNIRLNVEPDVGRWHQRVEAFSEMADLIKVSDEDLETLFPGDGVDSAISRWNSRGVRLIVVTRGSEGALVSLRGEVFEAPGRSVEVVDTVGAGDSFQAALLCGLDELGKATKAGLSEVSPDECRRVVDFAMGAAAVTCARRGADLPRRPDLPSI